MARVLVSSELAGGALELLAGHDVVLASRDGSHTPEHFRALLRDADAVLAMLTDPLPRATIEAAPRLRVIGNHAVGYDNIDVGAATERGVQVVNTPDVLTDATADFAFALLLAAARRVVEGDRLVRGGAFHGWRPKLLLGRPVAGKTLGVVGMGRIGSAVARRAQGFGMRILYHQRERLPVRREAALGATFVDKATLLGDSDFVSLHLPGDASTRHWLDRASIATLKDGAVVVNTGRGICVDETALADALASGRIAAGLDVFEHEPTIEPRLLALDNVVLAPHIGSATDDTRAAMARAVASDIARVLAGEAPESPVNRPR